MSKPTVLYILHDSNNPGGSAFSLLNMLHAIRDLVNPIVLARSEGTIVELLRTEGIICHVYEFSLFRRNYDDKYYHRYFLNLLRYNYRLYQQNVNDILNVLGVIHIDVVHANSSISSIAYGIAKKHKAKLVWHVREYYDLGQDLNLFGGKKLYRWLINRSDAIIPVTKGLIEGWGLKKNKSIVIGNAIRSANDAIYQPNKDKYILLCASNLSIRKGVHICAEAFLKSGIYNDGYRLRLIGRISDETKNQINILSHKYTGTDHIDVIPYTPEIEDHYINASAFIIASEGEGLGRVTIEAMFYGCPVIGRNAPGTSEIIKDGFNGYLFDTVEQCASLIKKVVYQNNEALIKRAQKYVIDNFSEEQYGGKIINVYNSIL